MAFQNGTFIKSFTWQQYKKTITAKRQGKKPCRFAVIVFFL